MGGVYENEHGLLRGHHLTQHGSTPLQDLGSLLSLTLGSLLPLTWESGCDTPNIHRYEHPLTTHTQMHSYRCEHATPICALTQACIPTNMSTHTRTHRCGNTFIMCALTQNVHIHTHVYIHESTFTYMDIPTPMQCTFI